MTHDARFWFHLSGTALIAVGPRPRLWPTAARQLRRSVPPRWWTRAPFLPGPDPRYLRFRLETAFGTTGDPRPSDLVRYLEWCRTVEVARAA